MGPRESQDLRSPSPIMAPDSIQQKKMIGHHARFRENDDLPLWQGPSTKKKPPIL